LRLFVIVAEPTLLDGKPGLREVRRWPWATEEGSEYFRFSADGRRVVTAPFLFDVESGAVVGCDRRQKPDNDLLDVVDTGRFACPSGDNDVMSLHDLDGGRVVATFGDGFQENPLLPEVISADSQWFGVAIHTPTATVRTRGDPTQQPWTGGDAFLPRTLRDGDYAFLSTGYNGKRAVNESSLGANSIVVIREYTTTPLEGHRSDLAERYQQRDWALEPSGWDVAGALAPYLGDGEGRDWRSLGLTEDGDGLMMLVKSWVISQSADPNIDPQNVEMEHAVVEVRRDGTSRGFKTGALFPGPTQDVNGSTYREVDFLKDVAMGEDWSTVLDLGGGEWLVSVRGGFSGFLKGEAVGLRTGDSAAFDGVRGLVEVEFLTQDGGKRRLCTLSLDEPLVRRCMPLTVAGRVVGVAAHEVRGPAKKPVLSRLSRTAAWPGSTVTLSGHGFGEARGQVRLGSTAVPEDHVLAWGPSQVTFRVPETLAAKATVELVTAAGATSLGHGRAVVLHRTELVTTPFSQLVAGTQAVGQGLTRLDLRGVPANVQGIGQATLIDLGDGGYVASVLFASDGGTSPMLLSTREEVRLLDLVLEPRLADPARWQPVRERASPAAGAPVSQWALIGGALVDVFSQVVTRLDTQLEGCALLQRSSIAPRAGVPDQWSTSADGGTLSANAFGVGPLTGWSWASPCQPVYGPLVAPSTRAGVASGGTTVLATGATGAGSTTNAGFALSQNGGSTFATPVSVQATLGRSGTLLVDPVWMGALAVPAFVVAERTLGGAYRTSLHALTPAGVLTPDVGVLPAAFPGDQPGAMNRVVPAVDGTRLALYFSNARTLVLGDLSGAAPVSFTAQPTAGDTGRVQSTWFDEVTGDLYAVLVDGQVRRATSAGAWLDWAPFDLGIELEVPTRVVPLAVARVPGSRRWLVTAQLLDARPGAAPDADSPITRYAMLLGPVPP
jgi:hypothetical protein